MKYRSLGKSGLQVSQLSFGAWVTFGNQVDVDLAADLMKTAYDAGVIFFDNAEVYARGQAEIVMGKAIQKLGWRRDSYLVSSKVHGGSIPDPNPNQWGLSRKHIYDACYQAMDRLQVDYLDLYFCHRPDARVPYGRDCARHDRTDSARKSPILGDLGMVCSAVNGSPQRGPAV